MQARKWALVYMAAVYTKAIFRVSVYKIRTFRCEARNNKKTPDVGIEPTTTRLRVVRSTTELIGIF